MQQQIDNGTIERLNEWCEREISSRHWGFVVSERGLAITLNYRAGLVGSRLTCEGRTPREAAENAIAMAEVGIRAVEDFRRRQGEGGG